MRTHRMGARRLALVVRGGWAGHSPVECTDLFVPFLRRRFDTVTVVDRLDVYADPDALRDVALIVQCWSDGTLTAQEQHGLCSAVRRGAGFAGWHGGVVATMRGNLEYSFLVGGQFVAHPGGFVPYRVDIASDHPVVAGLQGFDVETEQYFCHLDPTVDVHATTTFTGAHAAPETAGAVMPVVWTKPYGEGRVFVSTLGHYPRDLEQPQTRTITERGLLWAARLLP
ncbi:MAG: hypothetical protein JWM93_2539 [Frankiales bacterium]|nr:hypothetical protein [Frankiales bacterium]